MPSYFQAYILYAFLPSDLCYMTYLILHDLFISNAITGVSLQGIPFICICLDQSLTLASADDLNRRTGVLRFPSSSSKTTRILGTATVNVCLGLPSGKDGWPYNRFSEMNRIHHYIPSIAGNNIKKLWAQ